MACRWPLCGPLAGRLVEFDRALLAPTSVTGGRRSTSLFDLPRRGGTLIRSLGAQTRNPSPLTAALATGMATRDSVSGPAVHTQQSMLRPQMTRLEGRSRLLLAQNNPSRSDGGFGLKFATGTVSLLG